MKARDENTATEHTGPQTLVRGVAPITLCDRLTVLAAAPLAPRAAQKNCNHGLFDLEARQQTDLIDDLRRLNRHTHPSTKENK